MAPSGVVQFGVFIHRIEEREGRRIDFFGVNSREAKYLIADECLQT